MSGRSIEGQRRHAAGQVCDLFTSPDVQVLPVSAAVCDRAARIRAQYGFKPLDALHLAAAVEYGCTLFLTNDGRLTKFTAIPIEVLT